MAPDLAHDSGILDGAEDSTLALAPGGKQYYTTISKIEIYCLLQQYRDKGAAEKATQTAPPLMKPKEEGVVKGKHRVGDVNWNPRSQIEFPHTLTDGSAEALSALVDKIFSKYDTDEDNKLFLDDAMPFIKRFCKDEMEMDEVGKDFIEETWAEIDEEQKGFVEREDMMKYLQAQWELK